MSDVIMYFVGQRNLYMMWLVLRPGWLATHNHPFQYLPGAVDVAGAAVQLRNLSSSCGSYEAIATASLQLQF